MPVMEPRAPARRARAAGAAARRWTAGSRAWRAVRRRTGRSRAAPWRRGSGCPSSAARPGPGRGTTPRSRVATNAARSRTTRRRVGRGDDDDGAGQTFGSEVVLEELAHLAATLADQGEHADRRRSCRGRSSTAGSTCRRRSRRRCPRAGRGRRSRGVSSARTPSDERQRDPLARSRACGGSLSTETLVADERRTAVDGPAEPVEHPAEQVGARPGTRRPSPRARDPVTRRAGR